MTPFNVLDRGQNIHGGLLLEASAGTGKTFAMEHLVLRLLIESEPRLSLKEILVITFTRAATRELKHRIRSNLEKGIATLETGSTEWDYLQAVIERGEKEVFKAKERLSEALITFDEASIFTIHGFCHRLLSEHPFEAGVGMEMEGPDSQGYLPKVREALFDMLRTKVKLPLFSSKQLGHVLGRFRGDIEALVEKLIYLLEQNRTIGDYPSFEGLLEQCNEAIGALNQSFEAEKIVADFQALRPHYKKMTAQEFDRQVVIFAAMLEQGVCNAAALDALIEDKEIFLQGMQDDNRKKRGSIPKEGELNYPGLFETVRETLLPVFEEAKDVTRLLLRLTKMGQAVWAHHFAMRDDVPPDELLKRVDEALKSGPFLEVARGKYRAVMIDEFQDTDPVQWSLVNTLCGGEIPLYLVGDPKQSIYAFRKSDVYTYLEATRQFQSERCFALTTNYRSDPALIDALNTLFSQIPDWLSLPQAKSFVPYVPVMPAPSAENSHFSDGKAALHIFTAEGCQGREKSWPTKTLEEEVLFPYIVGEILNLPVSRDSIAILVKDRFQGQRIQAYLETCGIETDFQTVENPERQEVAESMVALMQAVLAPEDSSALKAALATPLVGYTEAELQDRAYLAWAKGQCQTLLHLWKERGLGAFFYALQEAPWKNGEPGLRYRLLQEGKEKHLLELQNFSDGAIEYQRLKRFSAHQIFQEFARLLEKNEDFSLVGPPLATDDSKVQIMTMHKSKGLEFDVVFAVGLMSRHTSKDEIVSVKLGESDVLVPLDESSAETELAEQELAAEKLRGLYVALTRAKKRAYLPLVFDAEQKEVPLRAASPCELFFSKLLRNNDPLLPHAETTALLKTLSMQCSLTVGEAADTSKVTEKTASDQAVTLVPPRPLALPQKEPILSFSSLAAAHGHAAAPEPSSMEEKSCHTLPAGAETGVVLHTILEKIFAFGLFSPYQHQAIVELIQETVKGTCLDGWEEVIETMVEENLHTTLDAGFSLVDVSPKEVLPEIEFLYPTEQGYLKGFIDLAFQKEGRVYLVDWKSNYLGSTDAAYTAQSLQAAMESHDYFLQASIYQEALRRYLAPRDSRPFETYYGGAYYYFLRAKKAVFIPGKTEQAAISGDTMFK